MTEPERLPVPAMTAERHVRLIQQQLEFAEAAKQYHEKYPQSKTDKDAVGLMEMYAQVWREVLANIRSQASGETILIARKEIGALLRYVQHTQHERLDDRTDGRISAIAATLRTWLSTAPSTTEVTK